MCSEEASSIEVRLVISGYSLRHNRSEAKKDVAVLAFHHFELCCFWLPTRLSRLVTRSFCVRGGAVACPHGSKVECALCLV